METSYVQAAFFFTVVFPPPSSGPEVLAGTDGTGAGGAADADESLIVQRVIGNIVPVDVIPDPGGIPVQERVVFDDPVDLVPFENGMILSFRGMFRAKSGNPDRLAR
jgi:hypothetical protein